MKKKFLIMLMACSMVVPSRVVHAEEVKYEDYAAFDIAVQDKLKVPFSKSTENYFEGGLVTGFGSAVTFKGLDEEGNLQFYAITDRGPNVDAPQYDQGERVTESKTFPCPDFTPSIGVLTIKDGVAVVSESIPIKDADNKNISGLPLAPGEVGATGEAALDMEMNLLGYDNNGLDTEGIAVDRDGNFWVCDEYGPFIAKIDSTGKLLEKYAPGTGLPEILSSRIPNRGFEGLTITPSGKVIASVQSVLDVNGETSKKASFVRFVEFDPETKATKMYAYPVDTAMYKSAKDCKIGDIYAVDDETLLVIEQGKLANKTMSNKIMKVSLKNATDITNVTYGGKELEYASKQELTNAVKVMEKELYIDLRAAGWTAEKAEGLCVLPGGRMVAVINDNDFGLMTKTEDPQNEDPDITDYIYHAKSGTYTLEDEQSEVSVSIEENTEPAQMWFFLAEEKIVSK